MLSFDKICGLISGQPRHPSFSLRPNRVDALPQLLHFDTSLIAPSTPTDKLPTRTQCSKPHLEKLKMVYEVMDAQNHAFYEGFHTIPAAAFGIESPFEKTRHWYIIHPLNWEKASQLTNLVLDRMEKWIEDSEHLYIGTSAQVMLFKAQRVETLALVQKELQKRGVKNLSNRDESLGQWEKVDNLTLKTTGDDAHSDETDSTLEPVITRRPRSGTITEEGLSQADDMAMKMVRYLKEKEADIDGEYEFIHM